MTNEKEKESSQPDPNGYALDRRNIERNLKGYSPKRIAETLMDSVMQTEREGYSPKRIVDTMNAGQEDVTEGKKGTAPKKVDQNQQ